MLRPFAFSLPVSYELTCDILSLPLRMTPHSSRGCCHTNPSLPVSYWDNTASGAASEAGITNPSPPAEGQAPLPALTLHCQVGRG